MQIDEFYSKSFVPNDMLVSYDVRKPDALNFNLTVLVHFPGKLLIQVFVRRLDDVPGGPNSFEMLKLKNVDFCKSLESLRNMTNEKFHGEPLIPSTFLMSCPLMSGFYYVENATLDVSVLPWLINDGRYFALLELVQVYEEVTRLINFRVKVSKKTPESELAGEKQEASNEDGFNDFNF
ncbi:uncharacterized protein LOC6582430 [Drosophila mojavensis]|uniref:Uncharacterized protein n=1 Tax=Drosophila mojavensis TaxID=7230 RepID=B4KWY8_DROMO|nr:uncharacterized protein LOC6582430 [Drosophila mojavensis]EDW18609.2 uncharacterized protein Dmoj_GI11989 [Drosophila mojavensis]